MPILNLIILLIVRWISYGAPEFAAAGVVFVGLVGTGVGRHGYNAEGWAVQLLAVIRSDASATRLIDAADHIRILAAAKKDENLRAAMFAHLALGGRPGELVSMLGTK